MPKIGLGEMGLGELGLGEMGGHRLVHAQSPSKTSALHAQCSNVALFTRQWACFDAHLRVFFVSCGLSIVGLVLTTLMQPCSNCTVSYT